MFSEALKKTWKISGLPNHNDQLRRIIRSDREVGGT